MKKYTKWVVMVFCLFIFCFIAVKVWGDTDIVIDSVFYDFIDRYFIGDKMTFIVKLITWFGSAIGIILMCALSMFIFRDKKINISIVCNLTIVTILNYLLKIIFMRARPDINPLVIETSYSFPSGHSMISMAFYGYLIYLVYTHKDNVKVRWILITLMSFLILLIGISRIYLGVHYASDVIGGLCFSISYLIIFVCVSKKILKEI